jgi:metal-responsive CopG/Arc/MetJ family transcriptional regulator
MEVSKTVDPVKKMRLVVNLPESILNEIWRLQYEQKRSRSAIVEQLLSQSINKSAKRKNA